MKNAIGYLRVSTPGQGQSGFGMDAQRAQIEKYAELAGYRISKFFWEVASGMGGGEDKRPEWKAAREQSIKTRQPIIVASLDRIHRNTEALEKLIRDRGLKIISAEFGPDVDHVVLIAQAARAQREGEIIGERTKAALQRKRAEGVKLGNRTNLPEAQKKGAAANRAISAGRLEEFKQALSEAREAGASSVAEIASALNKAGHRTARGGPWAPANVHRLLKKIESAPSAVTTPTHSAPAPIPKKSLPIYTADGRIGVSGAERVLRIIERRKLKTGDVMRELGLKPLDMSISNALRSSTKVKDIEKLVKLQEWLEQQEKMLDAR